MPRRDNPDKPVGDKPEPGGPAAPPDEPEGRPPLSEVAREAHKASERDLTDLDNKES